MRTSKQLGAPGAPIEEPCEGYFEGEIFEPGDKLFTFTQRYRSTHIQSGTYLGVIKTVHTYNGQEYSTNVKYAIRRDDGKVTYTHYSNFVRPDTCLTRLDGRTI